MNTALGQAFLNREKIVGVEYRHNDYVRITDGAHRGKHGSIVSLLAMEAEPTFLVELEQNGDVAVWQSQLCFISHDD